ncbi:MAG: hypothetical protein Q8L44_07465 [Sulfuritalea sp.]|nr:hypothetical protein [Sulfuritalea sp.]
MGILSGLGRWLGPAPLLEPAVRQAIERAVEIVEPILKTVSGYERKLAPAVSHALGYCEQLAADIPGPIGINARAFSADPLVHSLFAAPGDIAEMLGKSRDLRAFLADPAQCEGDDFFALLGMRQREKAVMGIAQQGGVLQSDVPQRLLYFADHTLGELGCWQENTRQRLLEVAFDGLAQGFAQCVAELRQERHEARTAWNMEHASPAAGRDQRKQVLEERQRQAVASLAPERLLQALADWLAAPRERLYLKPTVVSVDRMGVIAPHPGAGGSYSTLTFPELVGRDRRHWIVLVARISRQDARDALLRQEQANRYLLI